MARYDYDLPYRTGRYRRRFEPEARYGRRHVRGRSRRGPTRHIPVAAYGQDFALRSRLGMHDFSERWGRYSGGSPYSYEYSERTIEHAHPRPEHNIGFTRPLHEEGRRRFPAYGRGYERRRERRELPERWW